MDNGQATIQRPALKKIKRPINRAPMSQLQTTARDITKDTPQSAPSLEANPFIKENKVSAIEQDKTPGVSSDAFDLDKFLDDKQLPTVSHIDTNAENILSDEYDDYKQPDANLENPQINKSILLMVGLSMLFLGIIAGKFLFNSAKVVRNGLQGVVVNKEIPKGRARCGVAERNQGCVLYIMNPQRQDMVARDFYDLASQVTGRQRFVIETGNMRYSNTKIRPGDIVQLNIPPL